MTWWKAYKHFSVQQNESIYYNNKSGTDTISRVRKSLLRNGKSNDFSYFIVFFFSSSVVACQRHRNASEKKNWNNRIDIFIIASDSSGRGLLVSVNLNTEHFWVRSVSRNACTAHWCAAVLCVICDVSTLDLALIRHVRFSGPVQHLR